MIKKIIDKLDVFATKNYRICQRGEEIFIPYRLVTDTMLE